MTQFATLWFWQKSRLTAEWFETYSFDTEENPKPSLIRSPNKPTNANAWSYTTVDHNDRLVATISSDHLPNTPPLWYLLLREYQLNPLSQSLIGFVGDEYPDGTVVEVDEFKNRGFDIKDRACAIRWGFGDPHITQLYVAEEHRRKRMSIKLINVADIVNVAGNWGGFIYGGDQVTDMGAELAKSWSSSSRLKPVEAVMPPMD